MDFWEILGENWIEILGAIATITAVFFGTKKKKTPEEKQAEKLAKAKAKAEKKYQAAKKAADEVLTMEAKGGNNV